ncbi:ubiquitin-conjugating enzyme E2, partial [Flagellimonas marinaquae]
MAPALATSRLRKEAMKIKKEPTPDVIASPQESDILTWHFAVRGPKETPFEGGIYIGKLKFPSEYPMKPPSI